MTRSDSLTRSVAKDDERLLWGLADLMRVLDRSRASLDRDVKAGRLPKPIKLGTSLKWRKSDVRLWLDWNCPAADEFAQRLVAEKQHGSSSFNSAHAD